MAGTGWDAAAHRRECTIPPDQLKALNALPGWERTFQAAPLDETPDDSPASSQQGAREKSLSLVPEKTKSARASAPSPGAHARRQRAPVLSFDDEEEEEEEEENARMRADALVRAGRGDANPEMADPQTRGLRGVASAPPPAADTGLDDAGISASLLPVMEREGLAMAFSPARTRGRAAKDSSRVARRRSVGKAEAETDALEDIMPTQAADPEAQVDAARGAAAALATLFSPVGTRASRRRKRGEKEKAAEGYTKDLREEEAIAPTQAEPESPRRRNTRGGFSFSAAIDAVRGAVGFRNGASDKEPPPPSPRRLVLPETSGGEQKEKEPVRSPFAGRHRRKRLDDAREEARWDSFAKLVDVSPGETKTKSSAAEPTMAPGDAEKVVASIAAATADGPTPLRRLTSAFGDQGGDAPDVRGTLNKSSPIVGGGADPKSVDLASSLVASRFSSGKKRKRTPLTRVEPPVPTVSPAMRVVPVEEAARAASPDLETMEPTRAVQKPDASPVDALLARFLGMKKKRNGGSQTQRRSEFVLVEEPLRDVQGVPERKGVDALVDVDGDGMHGAPWYAGGTAEKAPPVSSKKEERAPRGKKKRDKRAGAPESERRDARQPARSPRTRRGVSDRAEEEFAAVLADMVDDTQARAEATAEREAAAAKSAVARPPSSVARAISFEGAREEKETPADALALFGDRLPRFRGKRQVSASTPRRTPAVAGVSAPKTKARDPRRSAMSLLGLGD